jgi:hypothetical protein
MTQNRLSQYVFYLQMCHYHAQYLIDNASFSKYVILSQDNMSQKGLSGGVMSQKAVCRNVLSRDKMCQQERNCLEIIYQCHYYSGSPPPNNKAKEKRDDSNSTIWKSYKNDTENQGMLR